MTTSRAESGGLIDRSADIRFTFDGKAMSGHRGDTLASALLANGVQLIGRSFKYHRPRGLMAAGLDEPNGLVTLIDGAIREPNIQATAIRIREGMVAESQNRFPSLSFDIGAVNALAGPLFGAGFYYKTFVGPAFIKGTRIWHFFEWFIRRAAGLGSASPQADTARYGRMNAFCDMLVIGGGQAGLHAAIDAARAGKSVILAESDPVFGGSARWAGGFAEAETLLAELSSLANVRLLPSTTVWGAYDGGTWAAVEQGSDANAPRQRHWVIRADKMVMATGAYERPLVFPGNDLPGVMLASAARRYAGEFGVLTGQAAVIFTNNDSAYAAAAALKAAGASISHIVDMRASPGESARELAYRAGAELLAGHCVTSADGGKSLASVSVSPCGEDGIPHGAVKVLTADCLLISGGWSPAIQLSAQAGATPEWSEELQAFLPPAASKACQAVGAAAGELDFGPGLSAQPLAAIEVRAKGKAFVDFQHDVTADDVRLAHREGFSAPEHMKRYTTLGMATDQGRTSGVNGVAILAAERGLGIGETGVTRFRPPFAPVAMGAIAAERFGDLKPHRDTPMQALHEAAGAEFYQAGLWTRPSAYPLPGETIEQAYVREAAAVRSTAGIVDVSTLGKIAVQGPDAAAFLDRVYTNMFSTLPVGKARYGLMLREDGFVMDDGTTWRLGQNDFLMTTTTANAGKVMQHLEYFLECVWAELRVVVTSVTDEWAGASIAGPKARDILASCVTEADVSDAQLPFMGIVKGEIADVPVLICRLSFSGELAYEVYSGAGHGAHVWQALIAAGEPFGMVRYGLEALGTLRIEKGHVTGAEIDGRTTARDLHLDWMLSKKKPFIGSAMMDRDGMTGPQRISLVGLVSADGAKFSGGAHLVMNRDEAEEGESLGHVTAMCFSPALGAYIGLALVRDGNSHIGERLYATDPLRGKICAVDVVSHHMFDPDGSRMHG